METTAPPSRRKLPSILFFLLAAPLALSCLALLIALFLHLVAPSPVPAVARISTGSTPWSNVKTSLDAFEVDTATYPATLNDLVTAPPNIPGWHGPYLEPSDVTDQWGNPYHFAAPGTHNPQGYDLSSDGPDRLPNTPDDLHNWP